jgi:apolipoprotein D and lipocalin family protein
MRSLLLSLALGLCACTGLPENLQPVTGFDSRRYLGTWYEIARLDHRFERGLAQVTATYGARDDGGISVVNHGYKAAEDRWVRAQGRAYPAGDPAVGHLKVSFFGPFYSSYVIFELSPDYRTAYVAGSDRDTLWLLSRSPQIDAAERARFIDSARTRGFDTSRIIWVEQPPS